MLNAFLLVIILGFTRACLRLRYKIETKGLDELKKYPFDPSRGILFLPNHPAEIDPVIIQSLLCKRFKPRPLVIEHFYYLKGWRFFMDLVGALPLPTMDVMANKWRAKKIAKQFDRMVAHLRSGGNLLIYPSGHLKTTGLEQLGGASLTHKLLEIYPDAYVVLIRTTGLWGSQFSKALTGSSPDFGKVLWNCVKIILKNGLFFVPKRQVRIEFEVASKEFPFQGSRLEVNQYLQNWYNWYPEFGEEPLKRIPYFFWSQKLPAVLSVETAQSTVNYQSVSSSVLTEVTDFLRQLSKRSALELPRSAHLSQDIGLDSLDLVQIYVFLDERYGISNLDPGSLRTVEDVLQAASGHGKPSSKETFEAVHPFIWPAEKRLPLQLAEGSTIQEVFLQSVDRLGSQIACVDVLSGSLTYKQLKMRAFLLAEQFKKWPGDSIGILLPSSVAAYLATLAVLLSGKIPVMLNWTVGVRALDHAVSITGIQKVLTSLKFLDKLENEELGVVEELFFFLEEMKEEIYLKDKLSAFLLRNKSAKALLKREPLKSLLPSDTAVILFTSGTESLPKAVPLSHLNILSNQRAALEAAQLEAESILYAVLPPFHSFGFSVTGLLPLLSGMRVCYAPDPTDSHGIAKAIAYYHPTLFFSAPSFLKALFRVADAEQLTSLKLIVSGAEKTPQELFDYVDQHLPSASLLEGYGITECSPIVTLQRPSDPRLGVGKPLCNVQLLIVDSESGLPVETGKEGEIYIAGPSVFSGYLAGVKSPFKNHWYVSGDRGFLTPEGVLILSGRSKRFIKIGGEMIGLNGLEEALKSFVPTSQEGPSLAISVRGLQKDKPSLILFTTFPITLEEVNRGLKQAGFGRIAKVSCVYQIKEIPLMGTGKINYRYLDELNVDETDG